MTLRQMAEKEAARWCICAVEYKRRDRIDPTCRCDAMAEMAERVAKAWVDRVGTKLLLQQHGELPGVLVAEWIDAAIAAAAKEPGRG